jgi:hypothetical protein
VIGAPHWSGLNLALELLERLAREGKAHERREIAVRLLEIHPQAVELHLHLVRASGDADGLDAARRALAFSARTLLTHLGRLPHELLAVQRELGWRVPPDDAALPGAADLRTITATERPGLWRVRLADGTTRLMTAGVLERVYALRVSAPRVLQ